MATIDSSIAMGYKPIQIENPLNQLAAYSQIQGAQQGQQMNMLKMQEYQRGLEEENKLRTLLSGGGDINSPDVIRQMYGISPTKGLEFQQKQALIKKAGLETTKLESEIVDNKLKQSRQFLDTIDPADPSSPARYLAWHEANHKDPVLGPMLTARGVTVDQSRANIDNAIRQGPQAFATLLNQSKLGVEKFAELNKPQVFQENLGGVNRVSTIPGMGGAPTTVSQTNRTATPGELMTDARARERLTLDQDKATRDLTMGTIPAGYRLNKVTNELEAIPGGPTTVALSPKDKQKREAAYPKATSGLKAFDDTSNSLIKDLAELRNHPGLSSITGIVAGRLPGATKDGRAAQALYDKIVARGGFQALTDLKAAGGTLGAVSNQEGTQLKDSWAAINRTQDADDVRKALDQALTTVQTSKDRIRDEYESTYEYRNTVPRSSTASSAAPATPSSATVNIKSNAEYDALPSGTIFIDPNGQQRRKP
jgi:hypothetical protein